MFGAILVLCGWAVRGGTISADSFRITARAYGDWYWLSPCTHAQWEFLTLPASPEPYVGLDVFLCLLEAGDPLPEEIMVRFEISTSTVSARRTHITRLTRVQVNHQSALYFGQIFLSRRELGLGSRLIVRLNGTQSRLSLGVHPDSLRARIPGGLGVPGPVTPTENGRGGGAGEVNAVAGGASASVERPQLVRSLPESGRVDAAPFLAPGVYRGELGWPGPYQAPDGKDVYRVSLRVGQTISLRLEAPVGRALTLLLLDPAGQRVGEVSGTSWLGMEHRAAIAGAWQIVILCREGGPRFSYTLTLQIW